MSGFGTELRARLPEHHCYFMDVIEQNLRIWIDRQPRFEDVADAAATEIEATGHQSALALIAAQATNISSRVVGLTEGFIALANDDNVYATPAVVRALHETCCVPCYMSRELIPRLRKGNPNSVNDLYRLLYRLGLGTGPGVGFGTVRAIPVDALNRAASVWVTEYLRNSGQPPAEADKIVRMIYAPLSDRTHPNFGATAPGWRAAGTGKPIYTLRREFDEEAIDQLLSGAFFMLIAAGEALDQVVAVATDYPTPFPPGEPRWHEDDLLKPGEESVLDTSD